MQSSYRAEVRALLHVVPRAGDKIRIVSDCKGAVAFFQRRLDGDDSGIMKWPEADLWLAIRDALPLDPRKSLDAVWMPAHLDEDRNAAKRANAIANLGVTAYDIDGNVAVDLLAKQGAAQHALPADIVDEARDRAILARHAHQMMVTIWHAREDAEKSLKHVDVLDAAEVDNAWEHFEPEWPEYEDYNPFGLGGIDDDGQDVLTVVVMMLVLVLVGVCARVVVVQALAAIVVALALPAIQCSLTRRRLRK